MSLPEEYKIKLRPRPNVYCTWYHAGASNEEQLAANTAFAPSEQEIAGARQIIESFEQARAEGKGVVVVNGRLVENLHVEEARRNLALADAIAAAGG